MKIHRGVSNYHYDKWMDYIYTRVEITQNKKHCQSQELIFPYGLFCQAEKEKLGADMTLQ